MALPLFIIGGAVVRAVAPRIVAEIIKRGGKKITQQAAKKINKNPPTITNINKIPKPSNKRVSPHPQIRTAAGMKPFKPLPRAAGTRKAGPKAGEVKVKPSTAVTTRKPSAVTRPKPSSVAVPKSRPTRPSMRNITPSGGQRALPKAPPSRPIPQGQRVANIGKAGAAGVTAATTTREKSGKPSTADKVKVMPTGPMSRPNRNAPNIGMPKPVTKTPSGAGSKRGPLSDMTTRTMPKKFDGGYNKKKQKLVNITIDGKKATYEIPIGMTTKEATSLLKGTAKKKVGGTPGKSPRQRMTKSPTGYKPVRKKNMVTNPEYFKASNRAAEKNVGAKNVPKKVKGFSKLPEKVQRKMNPKLAAMYEAGGYLSHAERAVSGKSKIKDYVEKGKPTPGSPKDRATKKLEFIKKPKKKIVKSKSFKGGGSVGNGKVARQIKGFGAARKPKK